MLQNDSQIIHGSVSAAAAVQTHSYLRSHNKKIHYAWVICIACTLMMYCNSGITDGMFSVYAPFILEKYSISNTQISLLMTVKSASSLRAVIFSGIYYKRYSLRIGCLAATILCGSSFVVFGFADRMPIFLLASVMLGIGNGLGTNIPITMLYGLWFNEKRKLAMSITTFAASVGLIGLPQIITHIIEGTSMRTAFLLNAALVFAVMLIVFAIMRNRPEDMGLKPYGVRTGQPKAINDSESKYAEEADDRELSRHDWLFLAPACVAIGIICCTSYSFFTLFLKNEGVSSALIAGLLTVTGISVGTGKLSYGWLADRFSSYICNRIYFGAFISGITLLTIFAHNEYILFIATVLMGFGSPLGSVGFVSWAWDLGGHMSAEAIRKMQIALYIGMMAFNFIPGVVADLCGGSYRGMYMMYAVLGIPTFLAIQYLYRRKGLNKIRQEKSM